MDHFDAPPPHHQEPDDAPVLPAEIPDEFADEFNDPWRYELTDDAFDALTPDDDYEPVPDPGDFWSEQDAP